MRVFTKQLLFTIIGLIIIGCAIFWGKPYVDAALKHDQKFEDWRVVCNKEPKKTQGCFIQQQVTRIKDDKEQVLTVYQIGYFDKNNDINASNNKTQNATEKTLRMIQVLPLGVNLQVGTAVITGNNTGNDNKIIIPGKYSFCAAIGCYAVAEISDKDLNTMLSNTTNALGFMTAEGERVNTPISVKGLQAALDVIKKYNSK